MGDLENKVYEVLEKLCIPYEKYDHPAVYTCREADIYTSGLKGVHTKNLFLKNRRGDNHYLVVMCEDKTLDIKKFSEKIFDRNLSFASADRLMKYLGLTAGSVSLFGIVNDEDHEVEVCIDEDIMKEEFINSHPNVNTSTLVLRVSDMIRFLDYSQNRYSVINLK